MLYVYTIFDHSKNPVLPLQSIIYHNKTIKIFTFFLPGTGESLFKIRKRIKTFKKLFDKTVVLNDFKAHLEAFGLDLYQTYKIYEIPIDIPLEDDPKRTLIKGIKQIKQKPSKWNELLADVQRVYRHLETVGLCDGYKSLDFRFGMTTTGRSKTLGFNVQGQTAECQLRLNKDFDCYIHLDWIAADIRTLSIMSEDEKLADTFNKSDPYAEMSKGTNLNRSECKINFLKGIYSLSFDGPTFDIYPKTKEWLQDKLIDMDQNGGLQSILGRMFQVSEDNFKSVFSGMIQGSVAHAMHNVLSKIFEMFPNNILVETHDSVTLMCQKSNAKRIIKSIKDVMLHPFDGILSSNPIFPFHVYVGTQWKQWKLVKDFR